MRIVSGTHKNRSLVTPKGNATRPTSEKLRGALFNICQGYIVDANFLDLFAGSGAMGIEALSRGAASATFVDNHRESVRAIQQNLRTLQLEDRSHIFQGEVLEFIEKMSKRGKSFDIIYADPPYETYSINHFIQVIDSGTILTPGGTLFIEESSRTKLSEGELKTLKLISSREMGRSSLLQFRKI